MLRQVVIIIALAASVGLLAVSGATGVSAAGYCNKAIQSCI